MTPTTFTKQLEAALQQTARPFDRGDLIEFVEDG
jgi:hypothetical protein